MTYILSGVFNLFTFFVYTNNHIYLTLIDIFNIKNDDEVIEEEEDVEDDNNKS